MNKSLNPNPLVRVTGKEPWEFTKADIISFIESEEIRMVSFKYPAQDGRLKSLDFVINDADYLDTILTQGERVDGSSLFPAFVQPGRSDLYIVPRFRSAFVDPFAEIPTLDFLCSFFDSEGNRFECDPAATLSRSVEAFYSSTGYRFEAMAELEYYVIDLEDDLFPGTEQKGYHESGPFMKNVPFRLMCMELIASCGGQIKYGHSEVGCFCLDGKSYEQNEIEFLPCPAEEAADQILIAKWIIRNLALQYGLDVTFAPKIIVGEAGSGMHIHMRIMDGERNVMTEGGALSDVARRAIAGMMKLAPSITAFGNKNPSSFLRLVPHQEAPTNICWGDSNRSALVRVPLGWTSGKDLCAAANPLETGGNCTGSSKQTVEMRSPDGSADIYELMAGLCVACRIGLEMKPDDALALAGQTYVAVNIHSKENSSMLSTLSSLPASCEGAADCLEKDRAIYESAGVFSPAMIDGVLKQLRSYGDSDLRERIADDPSVVSELVAKYFYCG